MIVTPISYADKAVSNPPICASRSGFPHGLGRFREARMVQVTPEQITPTAQLVDTLSGAVKAR